MEANKVYTYSVFRFKQQWHLFI